MLSWYRSQIKEHGFPTATRLFIQVAWSRISVLLSNRILPPRLECPCCGWKGRRFFDYIEAGYKVPNAACPSCDSHSRQRALSLWLRNEFHLDRQQGIALVFAPERALAPLWSSAPRLAVINTDIEPARGVNLLADVMHLPLLDESICLIWCHHVLEQVADDKAAMIEMYRVLQSAGGVMVISAGLSGENETREFGFRDPKLSGNRRSYGHDFSKRLEDSGFVVRRMSYDLSLKEFELYAVYPEDFFYCVRADYYSELPATDAS